ncbi:cell wall protein DAN4-like [Haliotis rubra]|uniref:cell wall protein DAN4-like n=1 Tax=Haliotis rubra TaxID=36100 RepID=UPI001EE5B3DD|nr:cell wall protein DAN4-like [Haliotis rubra]
MTPNQTPAVASTSQTSAVASSSQTPAVASTSQTPDVASTSKTPSTASTSETTTVSTHWTRKEPSSCEKVYERQQQVLSGELKLQALQTQKLLLQIKVLEMLEGKQVSEEMTPSQILMSLMQ